MDHGAHFSWYHYIPGLQNLEVHIAGAVVVALILMVFSLLARVSLAARKGYLVPDSKLSFLNFSDIVAEGLYKLTQMVLGKDAKDYLPIIGAIFLFIFVSNLSGLIPGLSPPTDNVNTTLACGIFVFLYYNYKGLRIGGIHYLKHFLGPAWYMAWLILPIEIISHVVRPFTLALRLKGNMSGDHTVLASFTDLAPYIVPVPIYFLGLLVCFLQAFIFVMLTMVYISMARDSEHH
ncbi:MAG: F0F1 ATP synthase subunit A [Oligoflexia bacterium]|nr:F0F1 ATP synthase subunit A [Oligoflexia bacterium]